MRRNYKEWDKMPLKLSPFINAELLQQKKKSIIFLYKI